MHAIWCAGLGLLVGAALPTTVRAQARDTLVKRDTARTVDSLARRDTAVKVSPAAGADTTRPKVPLPVDTLPRDTIKAPIAHAEEPVTADTTGSYHLDRAQIFASGAQNVGDLLERLPGITELRTGWMVAPATATYLGDAARVRVFVDGLEYQSLDPHANGTVDYARIPLWPVEAITVERSASEVRVYLNTWRVDRTTPYTRTDITTGDHQTNLYRGYFGRRFQHGELLQFGVEQFGTAPTPGGATSDQLSLMGRVGCPRGAFSADAFLLQVRSHRGSIVDAVSGDSIAGQDATRRDAYVRLAYGTPDHGPWLQGVASTARYAFSGGSVSGATPTDTAAVKGDTIYSGAQYLLTGGLTRWGLRLSGAARYFASFDRGPSDSMTVPNPDTTATDSIRVPCCRRHGRMVPSVRASYDWWRLSLAAFGQGQGLDSVSRREVSAQFRAFSFLRFSGAIGTARDARIQDTLLTPSYRRLEAGLRIHDFWVGGGTIMRGAAALAAPTLVNDSLTTAREPSATATFITVQGRVWKGIHADAFALKWSDSTGLYRPQYQTHSLLYISTALLDRFPRNTFHFYLGLTHEYRSATYFPMGDARLERLPGYRTIGAQLEIRIERAVLSYRFTNALGERYSQVPGFEMPRQSSVYGVRWEFWN